jgi:hypothetical protein
MDRVEEIEAAIDRLPPDEFHRLEWFRDREEKQWDEQMDRDASGKLDFPFEEADSETRMGLVREWPPAE